MGEPWAPSVVSERQTEYSRSAGDECVDMGILNDPYSVAANGCMQVSPSQRSILYVQIRDLPGEPDVNVPYTWTDNCSGGGSGIWTGDWQAAQISTSFPG
jgi:hypothetical protein